MEADVKFGCTGCGLCCRQVARALANPQAMPEPYKSALKQFPYKAKEDGSCENLLPDNKCAVYEDRPLLCNVDKMFDQHKGKGTIGASKKNYLLLQAKSCNSMINNAGIDKKFIVDETPYLN